MPLIQSGMSLVVSSVVASGLGFVFWLVAARQFTSAEIGISSAIVTAMILLTDFSQLGLKIGLVRFLPTAGADTRRLIVNSYVTAASIAAVAATVFVVGLDLWAPDLDVLRSSPYVFVFFVLSVACWVLFVLEDSVLLGLRMAPWVPIENGVFGLLKIVLLFPLAAFGGEIGVFLAWAIPVFVIVGAVNVGIRRRLDRGPVTSDGSTYRRAPKPLSMRTVFSYSLVDWTASASRTAVIGVLPLLVLAQRGSSESAYYFLAWTIAYSIYFLSNNVADALVAEASYDEDSVDRHTLHSGLLSMAISVPIVVVAAIAAPLVLRAFGAEYAAESATVLRLLLVGAIPNVVVRTFIGRLRAERRMGAVFAYEASLAVAVLVSSWLLLGPFGIEGLGIAWLAMLSVAALYALSAESVWWWAPRLDTRIVNLIRIVVARARRLERFLPALALDAEIRRSLEVRYDSLPQWKRIGVSHDTQTVTVDGHQGRPPLRVELARTERGNDRLRRRHRAVQRLMSIDAAPALRAMVPYPIEYSDGGDRHLLIESVISGRPGNTVTELPVDELVARVLRPIGELHAATAERVEVDNVLLERWVVVPLRAMASSNHVSLAELAPIERALMTDLDGRTVDAAMLHGSLTLTNSLFDTTGRLTGLLNWEWTGFGPSVIDRASLALSALSIGSGTDPGILVRRLMEAPEEMSSHLALATVETDLDPTTIVLLAWLRHVVPRLVGFQSGSTGRFWVARNVVPVLGQPVLTRRVPA